MPIVGVTVQAPRCDIGHSVLMVTRNTAVARCAPVALVLLLWAAPSLAQAGWFTVRVVDTDAVPLSGVRLETTNQLALTTDRNGVAAFYEPGLMDTPVFFAPTLTGFEHAADGFGFRGRALTTTAGGEGVLTMTRTNPGAVTTSNASDRETRLLAGPLPTGARGFVITANSDSGRGVPLTQIFVDDVLIGVTDNGGRALLFDPDLITATAQTTTLEIKSDGYVLVDAQGAAQDSVDVELVAGGETVLQLVRTVAAERLYRITGAGTWRDTVLLGLPVPVAQPLLNAGVVGQDSALSAVYRGEGFYVWGDTTRISYPLGNFHAAGARFAIPDARGVSTGAQRDQGIDLRYIENEDGFAGAIAQMPGPGPTWLDGLVVVDDDGVEALYATYGKYPALAAPVATGLVRFDDATDRFVQVFEYDLASVIGRPEGQSVAHDGLLYFRDGVRVAATVAGLQDPASYASFTPVQQDGSVERDDDGVAVYRYRTGGVPVRYDNDLPGADRLRGHEHDVDSGSPIVIHGNDSVVFHKGIGRYIKVAQQIGGDTSFLGELFLFAADTPHGPWSWGRKIVTHDGMTFYNARIHTFLNDDDDIYFEGTFTKSFSSTPPVPRADYNQVMMRVPANLAALRVPVPLYANDTGGLRFARNIAIDVSPGAPVAWAFDDAVGQDADTAGPVTVAVGGFDGPCALPGSRPASDTSDPGVWFIAFAEQQPGTVALTIADAGGGLKVGDTLVTRGARLNCDNGSNDDDSEGENPAGFVLGYVYPALTAVDPDTETFRPTPLPVDEEIIDDGDGDGDDDGDGDGDGDGSATGCGCNGGTTDAMMIPGLTLLLLRSLRRRRR